MSQHKQNPIRYSEQEIQNEGFNDAYKIPVRAMYGYDSATDSFLPINAKSGFNIPPYDYVSVAYATLTDTYTFYKGGVGGTLVATITLTYTDATKTAISNVARS